MDIALIFVIGAAILVFFLGSPRDNLRGRPPLAKTVNKALNKHKQQQTKPSFQSISQSVPKNTYNQRETLKYVDNAEERRKKRMQELGIKKF